MDRRGEGDREDHPPECDGFGGLTVTLPEGFAAEELVLAYREDGELVELATMEPPVYAELRPSE